MKTFAFVVETASAVHIKNLLEEVGTYRLPFLPSEYSWLEDATADLSEEEIFVKYVNEELEFKEQGEVPDLDDLLACICSCGNPGDIGDGSCTACFTGMTSVFEELALDHLPRAMHPFITSRRGDHFDLKVEGQEFIFSRSEHPHEHLFDVGINGYDIAHLEGTAQPDGRVLWHISTEEYDKEAVCTMRYPNPRKAIEAFVIRAQNIMDKIYHAESQGYDCDYGEYGYKEEGPFGGAFRDQDDYEHWRFGGVDYLNSI